MKMFEREDLWLSDDEIMDRAYKKFLEVGKTKGLFSLDDPQQHIQLNTQFFDFW